MTKLTKYDENATADQFQSYQRKVGSLLYASGVTRPDISRAVGYLSEFKKNPGPQHNEAAHHCFYYLYDTKDFCNDDNGSSSILPLLDCSADAAFGNTSDRRSVQGFVFKLFNGPIHWNSSKQATITTSPTGTELLSLSNATKELIWINRLFKGLQFDIHESLHIFNDNIQTIRLLNKEDPMISSRLKHVDFYQH